MSSKSKTTAKPAAAAKPVYKTKKAWPDGGVRTIATDVCKKPATAAAVARALSKAREKNYSEKTTLGILNWLSAQGFIERVEA
jgi:hypothetical protein